MVDLKFCLYKLAVETIKILEDSYLNTGRPYKTSEMYLIEHSTNVKSEPMAI